MHSVEKDKHFMEQVADGVVRFIIRDQGRTQGECWG